MYSLTIHFGPNMMAWALLFKEKEKAGEALITAQTAMRGAGTLELIDDFGQHAVLAAGAIAGAMLEDLELSGEARILRGLDQARNEAKARQRASTDAVIRQGAQGPAVISPMGNGRFS